VKRGCVVYFVGGPADLTKQRCAEDRLGESLLVREPFAAWVTGRHEMLDALATVPAPRNHHYRVLRVPDVPGDGDSVYVAVHDGTAPA
jgi:hypothetical protein